MGRDQRRWLVQRDDGPPAGLPADRTRATRWSRRPSASRSSCTGSGDHHRSRLHARRDRSRPGRRSRPASTPRTTRTWRTSPGPPTVATPGSSSTTAPDGGRGATGDGVASLALSRAGRQPARSTPGCPCSAAVTSPSSASASRADSLPIVAIGSRNSWLRAFVASARRRPQRRVPWLFDRAGCDVLVRRLGRHATRLRPGLTRRLC